MNNLQSKHFNNYTVTNPTKVVRDYLPQLIGTHMQGESVITKYIVDYSEVDGEEYAVVEVYKNGEWCVNEYVETGRL